MQENTLTYNHKKLFYQTTGLGPLVVLVHGFAEQGSIWNRQFDALPGFRLVIPDLPGSGNSEILPETTMESLSEALKAIIDEELKILPGKAPKKVILIGHSMGGYVALTFAEKYPGLLYSLGLFHSTAYPDSEAKKDTRKKGIAFIEEHGSFEFLKTSIPGLYSPRTIENNYRLIEEQIAVSHNFSPGALVSYYKAMINRKDHRKTLKWMPFPVLFILGKYDVAVPLQDGLEQCHMPDFSYIHILDRSGHMGMREEYEKSNQILSAYLNTIDLAQ